MKALEAKDALRLIPPVHEILQDLYVEEAVRIHGRTLVLDQIRASVELLRKSIASESDYCLKFNLCSEEDIMKQIMSILRKKMDAYERKKLKKVINATGIVLHTNLGRAPLPQAAIQAMTDISEGYSNLEYDLEEGKRGSRHSHIEAVVRQITGAEAGMIVNNNAAAVFLCLNTFANQKEVIVSRGEQVEIGGSFRIPDIITRSGSIMVEVGTTNKTHLEDYENAISQETAILLKVHTSNYKVTGFTQEVTLKEMADLGREKDLLVMEDLGSGCLIDLNQAGIPGEKTVQDCLKDGADLVTFSGDKLLGGPQAGIIVGKKEYIDRLKKNPLARMVRCDKTTIAALKAVFDLYREKDLAVRNIPALAMMTSTEEELERKAAELQESISRGLENSCRIEMIDEWEEVGGGSLPGVLLKGKAVAVIPDKGNINGVQNRLRNRNVPVICRVSQDRLVFHVRTINEQEIPVIAEALIEVLGD